MKTVPNVREIVQDYLLRHRYDGLCMSTEECGCRIDDLMPCGSPCDRCRPGYFGRNEEGEKIITERREA